MSTMSDILCNICNFDTLFAIVRRALNHKPIMGADRGHLHHRLLDNGFTQKETVAILYVIATVMGICAVLLLEKGSYTAAMLLMIAVSTAFGLYKLMRKRFNMKHQSVQEKANSSSENTEEI